MNKKTVIFQIVDKFNNKPFDIFGNDTSLNPLQQQKHRVLGEAVLQ